MDRILRGLNPFGTQSHRKPGGRGCIISSVGRGWELDMILRGLNLFGTQSHPETRGWGVDKILRGLNPFGTQRERQNM